MERARESWVAMVWTWAHRVPTGIMVQVKKRYGPGYTKAILVVAFVALFLPIPGSALFAIAFVIVAAEVHRAISKRRGLPETGKELIMSMNCNVIFQWTATPEQLAALGAALWRWCNRPGSGGTVYQNLDNQALTDLIAGTLPAWSPMPRQGGRRGVNFWVCDEGSCDRHATIARLRREIPTHGVEDIVVDGRSWNLMQ